MESKRAGRVIASRACCLFQNEYMQNENTGQRTLLTSMPPVYHCVATLIPRYDKGCAKSPTFTGTFEEQNSSCVWGHEKWDMRSRTLYAISSALMFCAIHVYARQVVSCQGKGRICVHNSVDNVLRHARVCTASCHSSRQRQNGDAQVFKVTLAQKASKTYSPQKVILHPLVLALELKDLLAQRFVGLPFQEGRLFLQVGDDLLQTGDGGRRRKLVPRVQFNLLIAHCDSLLPLRLLVLQLILQLVDPFVALLDPFLQLLLGCGKLALDLALMVREKVLQMMMKGGIFRRPASYNQTSVGDAACWCERPALRVGGRDVCRGRALDRCRHVARSR